MEHSWTGGSDAAKEGTWTWSNLTPFVYTNWMKHFTRKDEPNNSDGNENCLEMRQHGWNDQKCDELNPFVCKITNVNGNLCFSANRKCSFKRSFLISIVLSLKIINMIKKFNYELLYAPIMRHTKIWTPLSNEY